MSGFYQMDVKPAPTLRACLNVGTLRDIPTGAPVLAEHGRYITNGGHNGSVIVVGPGNSYKSAIIDYDTQIIMFRAHRYSSGMKYDTENNAFTPGLEMRLRRIVRSNGKADWFETGRWLVTESSVILGEDWFTKAKEWMNGKKNNKDFVVETPMLDRDGKKIKIIRPTAICLDSVSKWEAENTINLRDKTDLTDSKQKMLHMNTGLLKRNMIDEMVNYLMGTNTYLSGTVHYGEKFQLDPYAPQHKSLQHMERGMELKGAPKNINYLAMSMWLITKVERLLKDDNKEIRYPLKDGGDDNNLDDLNIVTMKMLRCKTGPSGYSVRIVVSQKYGILEELTNFQYLRENGFFGLGGDISLNGNFKSVHCVLMPEVKFGRTTVRSLMDENRRLARAIQICADMHQMHVFWKEHLNKIDARLMELTPETLFTKIVEAGYDWDMLLSTRYWYSLDDEAHTELELTTLDLMRMALGLYHPYWLDKDKKTILKKYRNAQIEAVDIDAVFSD